VTRAFLEVLVAQSWVRDKYVSSDYAGNTFQCKIYGRCSIHSMMLIATMLAYGVVIISKYPCRKFELHPFPSTMARALLIGVFYINGEEVGAIYYELDYLISVKTEILADREIRLFWKCF
jgi:endonuclease/exonuclease/phosphatase family metal-dependent hydrolase